MMTSHDTSDSRGRARGSKKSVREPSAHRIRVYLFWKRFFDVLFSLLLILLLSLPMLLLAFWIRLDSKGPAIFRQVRLGLDGQPFTIYKFRTMHVEAPSNCASNALRNAELHITRAGKILRRTSLDELPQLFNILRGEMSFIGYRPVCVTETELNELRFKNGVFCIKPGLTGLAQINGRDLLSNEEKVKLDLLYAETCSLRLDLYCLYRTLRVVISGEGILP